MAAYGHDVDSVLHEGMLSQPDLVIGAEARRNGRMLFTLDVGFADIRKHQPGDHPGIVLFRPKSFGPISVNGFVKDFVQVTDLPKLQGCLAVVESGRIRVRYPANRSGEGDSG